MPPVEDPSADDRLFEEALELIVRLQKDPANPVARDLVRCWRARGPEHEAAWAEVAEIHGLAGKVLTDRRASAEGQGLTRRRVLAGGTAAALAAGLGALMGPDLLIRARSSHITATAEVRRVPLADGTIATLGPDSALRSDMTGGGRHVELLAGMAFFAVAPDPARPFRAHAGGLTAIALGTAFDISTDGGTLSLSVDHGLVEARMPGSALATGERLRPGDWLTLGEDGQDLARGRREPGQIAAWRDGMIIAERDTVASTVARIARWQRGRVVIADGALGQKRISGVFDPTQSIAALQAVVQPHGGKVRQISPWLTVVSSI
ncbi:iron dicitrate transporter FecR [Agaricicola taiwanensis]|uniref:Iron dicitrate transporter FecR n=1 Tax=Agaricicola taiwanensis TaxID=591372 RepID=A0A8J3DZU8_9RHOB|nr:FecR domain-containing protein [Agaricicola taiwanensis]GGE52035.1 iron dicitrate transporter FecR [Agaricicola taiwanensis]